MSRQNKDNGPCGDPLDVNPSDKAVDASDNEEDNPLQQGSLDSSSTTQSNNDTVTHPYISIVDAKKSHGDEEIDAVNIEEGRAAYKPGGFHPIYIGDIFKERYRVLNKIGYGIYSTVWLVKDLTHRDSDKPAFLALKVLSAECYGQEKDIFERDILKHLKGGDKRQLGYAFACHLVDDFEHEGSNGNHVCLVFELMVGVWFREHMIPNSVMRRFTIQLLLALDFARNHNVIHTDIKPDNIFVKFRGYSLIESGYLAETAIPQQNRHEEKYSVIPSASLRLFYFNDADFANFDRFDVTLGDWGASSWVDKHPTEKIQPVALRSPEVLIGAPWNTTTDWWNLGAVILEVFRAVRMFSGEVPPDGHYELKEHLAEIIDLLGPFPRSLLDKGDPEIVEKLFDHEGRVKESEPMRRGGLISEDFTPGLDHDVRKTFVQFLKTLMKIDPNKRLSTMDLLRQPWLGAIRD